ncbi:hypothetical protein RSAG8_09752, partial [Rhizoctonia solani AG-8 WAC10335]
MDDRMQPKNKPKRKASSRRALSDQTLINNINTPNAALHASTGPPVAGTKTFEPSRPAPRPPHRSNSTTEGLRGLAARNMSTSSVSVNAPSNTVPALRRRQSVSAHPSASKSVDNFNNHAIYVKAPPSTAQTRPLSPRQLGKLPALPQLIPNPTGNPLPRPPNFIRPTAATPAPRPAHPPPPTPQHRHRTTKIADSVPSTSKVELPEKSIPTPATSTASSTHQPRPHASPEDITMNLARMILTPPHTQRMVTYPGTSQYSAGGPSACGLTSLNAVRCVLQLEQTIRVGGGQIGSGPVGLSILGTMTKLEFVKDVMGIAPHWRSSEHLEVEDILGLPLFTRSLTCIGTEQRLTSRRNFKEVLSILQTTRTNNSAAAGVLITRPPEIISILHFPASLPVPTPATFSSAQSTPQPPLSNVFAIFDSHTRPTHPTGSAFVVSASIDQTARYLEKLFAVDPDVLEDGGALLGAFDAHFVVPGDTPPTVS